MDMILQAFGMLFTMAALFAIGFLIYKNYLKPIAGDKRPQSKVLQPESKILNALDNLVNLIPGQDPKDQELNQLLGHWSTAASFPIVWETVRKKFDYGQMVNAPDERNNWKIIKVYDHLREIRASATKEDRITYMGFGEIKDRHVDCKCTVAVTLKFHALESGGTRIDFTYEPKGQDPSGFSNKIIRATNHTLRTLCLNLTANPDTGIMG